MHAGLRGLGPAAADPRFSFPTAGPPGAGRPVPAGVAALRVAVLVLSWSSLRLALVPRAVRRARAHRAAMEQFFARGLSLTKNRAGVLIFVALAERYVRIIADEGVASKVRDREWQMAVDALT